MIACTRSSPKKLTNTIHHEIRRAIQPLHLFMTFTFCVTHTFPLLFSWGPCVRLSMNSGVSNNIFLLLVLQDQVHFLL